MVGIALFIIILLYALILQGRFANFVVSVFQVIFFTDYNTALGIYERYIRGNAEILMITAVAILFLILLYSFLNWFTKYFKEISRGINELIDEKSEDIVLVTELNVIEKKLNYAKQTLKKRQSDSQLTEQRKNDLIVYLAHDLKTPLTSVIGYLTLLRDERQISPELQEKYLSISLSKAERLEELINEFFEITRFNLSGIVLELSRVNLTRMLEQLVFEFEPMLKEKHLKCTLSSANDIMVKFDVDRMQRVFDNLLRNAVNYSFDDSIIKIKVMQSNDEITIIFSNHGNTIPQQKLERIFEQFYRLDSARTSKSGGAGLGLAISKEIVELHGGKITAISKDDIVEFSLKIPHITVV